MVVPFGRGCPRLLRKPNEGSVGRSGWSSGTSGGTGSWRHGDREARRGVAKSPRRSSIAAALYATGPRPGDLGQVAGEQDREVTAD